MAGRAEWSVKLSAILVKRCALTFSQCHHSIFEFPFGCSFQKLVDFTLDLITDLLVIAFLAKGAGDVTDFKQVGLYGCPAQIGP